MVRRAVPAGIDETLAAFEDPATQRRVKALLGLPEVQEAARQLGEGLTSGALDGLGDEERVARAKQLSADYVAALTRAVGEALQEEVSPAVAEAVERSVARALAAALSPTTRREAAALVEALTRRTVTTLAESVRDDLGPALRTVLERDLGPAMEKVLADNLGPALRKVVEEDLTPAIQKAASELTPTAGKVSREVSREVVLGVLDALEAIEQDERLSAYGDRFWGRVNTTIHQGIRWGEIIAWILVLVVIILGLLLIRAIVVRRQLEAERERSERMLIGILQELQKSGTVRVDAVVDKVCARDPELSRSNRLAELIQRAIARTRDLFDEKPDFDGKPDGPPPPKK